MLPELPDALCGTCFVVCFVLGLCMLIGSKTKHTQLVPQVDDKRSSCCTFAFADSWKYALVVGGYTSNQMIISNVEVLSLEMANGTVPECMRSLSDFPSTLALASGGLTLDGRPLVCGGYYDFEITNKCFVHFPNDSWIEVGAGNATRSWVASDYRYTQHNFYFCAA